MASSSPARRQQGAGRKLRPPQNEFEVHLLRVRADPQKARAAAPAPIGDTRRSTATTRPPGSPISEKAPRSDPGMARTGTAKRPRAASHTRLVTNIARQKRHQRLTVRTLTAKVSHSRFSRSGVGPSRKTGRSNTSTPQNTLRPRKRRDGGVIRRRHPSVAQQKLNRIPLPRPKPGGPPRGFRSYAAPCSTPPHPHPPRRASPASSSSRLNSRSNNLESRSKDWYKWISPSASSNGKEKAPRGRRQADPRGFLPSAAARQRRGENCEPYNEVIRHHWRFFATRWLCPPCAQQH